MRSATTIGNDRMLARRLQESSDHDVLDVLIGKLRDLGYAEAAEAAVCRLNLSRGGYTQDQLKNAFTLVESQENWKYPIDAEIPANDRHIVATAIEFFAGGQATFTAAGEGRLRVKAPGYYALIGA